MKKLLFFILATSMMASSCTSSANRQSEIRIAQALQNEGEIFQAQGNYTSALSRLLEAQKTIPDDPYLQNSLGLAYMGKKRNDLAMDSFKKAIKLKPDFIEAINNLGAAYMRLEEWDLALESFKTVLEDLLYPTPHFPLSNMGWAYLGKKEYKLAQTYFLKSLDVMPWFVTASHGLAQVYLQTGRANLVIDYINSCLARTPGIAILHSDLAFAYEATGQYRDAKSSWQMVLRLAPERSALARQAAKKLSALN